MTRIWFWMGLLALSLVADGTADVVHLKSGGQLSGKVIEESAAVVVIETRFGTQRIERAKVERIERGATPAEEIEQKLAALAADDADGRFALVEEARRHKLKKLAEELLAEVLRVDPQHKAANELLGNVLFKGRYVSVADRDRLVKQERDEQMRSQGLVEFEGRFVTPEDKDRLARGLVLRDGKWISQEEDKALDGMVKHNGGWIPYADFHIIEVKREIEQKIGKPLHLARTDHVAVYTDVDGLADKLTKILEQGWQSFSAEFATGADLTWFGRQRADFFVFRSRMDYQTFLDYLGRDKKMGIEWAERAKQVISFYRHHEWGFAATYVANRGEVDVAHHMANQLGHLLLNSYRSEGRRLPAFFDDSFAALMEFDLMQRNLVFTLGTGRYDRALSDKELAFFEDGNWVEPLRDAMRTHADTPLDAVVRRDFGELTQMDVGKGMALYQRWRKLGDGRVKRFIDALRDRWPAEDLPVGHVKILAAVSAAFRDVEGKEMPLVDEELRSFVMKAIKK